MSQVDVNDGTFGSSLQQVLVTPEIVPGQAASYSVCKAIFAYHPMGAKVAESPIKMAQSQRREITVQRGPQERLVEAFNAEWDRVRADDLIRQVAVLARVYGIATGAVLCPDDDASEPLKPESLYGRDFAFNVFDPLNTAGSLVLNQDPNSPDFLKPIGVAVNGIPYHRSRTVTLMHEQPIYIEYTSSAFGYVGRSIYQRSLYPLKSFLRTQVTNDMVAMKAGVLIAKVKQQSSITDRLMSKATEIKRNLLKEAQTYNVISIAPDEEIGAIDLTNVDGAHTTARKNIIEDIATGSGTPAKLLLNDTFASGFGEGTEDAKHIAQHIDDLRMWMKPLYDLFDEIVQRRAWNPDFWKLMKAEFPSHIGNKKYEACFREWSNNFKAQWPSLIEEPESDKVEVEKVKLEAAVSAYEVLGPALDPVNKVALIRFVADAFNSCEKLFPTPIELDFDELEVFVEEQKEQAAALAQQQGDDGDEPGEEEPKAKAPKPKTLTADSSKGNPRVAATISRLDAAIRARYRKAS